MPGCYITPESDLKGYYAQSVEKDAFAYGERFRAYVEALGTGANSESIATDLEISSFEAPSIENSDDITGKV